MGDIQIFKLCGCVCVLQGRGQEDLKKRVDELAKSLSTDLMDKVGRALRAVRTLASKGRDPGLVLDALDDLVAAATRAQVDDNKIQLYKKVTEQCRKMDHLDGEDFGQLCLCLLGDNIDQKITEGLARFNKLRRSGRAGKGKQQERRQEQAPGPAAQSPLVVPPPGYPWQYQTPLPAYPPPADQGSYGPPRRGRGRGRGFGGMGKPRACYFCKREGHYMENCDELKALRGQQKS